MPDMTAPREPGNRPEVVHVCIPNTARGSRVHAQLLLDHGRISLLPGVWPGIRNLLLTWRNPQPATFVFHQHTSLAMLMVNIAVSKVLRRPHRFVLDLHDLAETQPTMGPGMRLYTSVMRRLEVVAARGGCQLLTVSQGLARIITRNTGRETAVFMNIPTNSKDEVDVRRSVRNRACYFGVVTPQRFDLASLRALAGTGMQVDLWGRLPQGLYPDFCKHLLSEVHRSGGSFRGEYLPDDTTFLDDYGWSLMLFKVDNLNLRYCLPNKLFQSLNHHVACLVSPELQEIKDLFGETGAVQTLDDVLSCPDRCPDWQAVDERLSNLRSASQAAYLRALGLSTGSVCSTEPLA